MTITIRKTKELLKPEDLKLKILVYGPSGVGKSMLCSTAPSPLIAACETGFGGGLLSVADRDVAYIQPSTYSELEQFCSGSVPESSSYETLVLDGMSYVTDTMIKDYALTVPRQRGESKKRLMGVPEMDDYGTMAELERRILAKLLTQPKHIIVTCLMNYYQPPESGSEPKPERPGGPDLPGQMRLGSTAMFDVVMRLWTRPMLKNPNAKPGQDPGRYHQRYFLTDGDGKYLAKCRLRNGVTNIFPTEVEFDLETGKGTFEWFLSEAKKKLAESSR